MLTQGSFALNETSGACVACPPQATSCIVNATGTFADSCAGGLELDAASGQCKPCAVEHCISCSKLGINYCDINGW